MMPIKKVHVQSMSLKGRLTFLKFQFYTFNVWASNFFSICVQFNATRIAAAKFALQTEKRTTTNAPFFKNNATAKKFILIISENAATATTVPATKEKKCSWTRRKLKKKMMKKVKKYFFIFNLSKITIFNLKVQPRKNIA